MSESTKRPTLHVKPGERYHGLVVEFVRAVQRLERTGDDEDYNAVTAVYRRMEAVAMSADKGESWN